MTENISSIEKIPRSKAAIKDMAIAGAFIAMSLLLPGNWFEGDFQAQISGMAFGIGFGWLVKSIICHQTLKSKFERSSL